MKQSIKSLSFCIFITSALLTSCSSSAEKVVDAKEDVNDAQQKLDDSNNEYQKDMKEYKEKSLELIAANEKSIQEFNARIAHQKSDAKADYEKQIADLNNQNTDMKKRLSDFKTDSKSNWEVFKTEFGQDMDKLGIAIHNFTIKSDQ